MRYDSRLSQAQADLSFGCLLGLRAHVRKCTPHAKQVPWLHSYATVQQGAEGTAAGVLWYLFMLLKCPQSLLGLSGDLHSQHPFAYFDGRLLTFRGSL